MKSAPCICFTRQGLPVSREKLFSMTRGGNLARFGFAKEDYILDEVCRRIEALRRL